MRNTSAKRDSSYVELVVGHALVTGRQYEPSREKTNIMASAKCIDPDQPEQSAQTDPGRYIPSQGDRGIE